MPVSLCLSQRCPRDRLSQRTTPLRFEAVLLPSLWATETSPTFKSGWPRRSGWAGALDESALPAYQFVNWIKYYRYDNGQFVLDWTDDFDSFDGGHGAKW